MPEKTGHAKQTVPNSATVPAGVGRSDLFQVPILRSEGRHVATFPQLAALALLWDRLGDRTTDTDPTYDVHRAFTSPGLFS